ncbi:type II secretion system minor pseudopilin GspK [Aestuariicella hydrocarbonica]|uniref:Type II secretion system protein K n=1 Tax=Pseudomaricurvus hydrocarbonicus TaxID=1470433 RepID=A0A9E5JP63_9GAMM|nr:type II secretion system minor pseudopilin GspK [Aestuariicella hydrocarbonica]NHO63944.1 type II secretion system minor pseudopilin GspK [Aestuariicella hydrocarbonica]
MRLSEPQSNPNSPCPARREQGVALISMLLIFSLVVILVSTAVNRTSYDIRKTSYYLLNSQAYQYALGGEELARQILYADWLNDQKLGQGDYLAESWQMENLFEPEGGLIQIHLHDLNSRFNLNNLVDSNGQPEQDAIKQFQRLAGELKLTQDHIAAIVDWLDSDTQPQTANSEDVFFLSRDNAYRSADGPMSDTSELNALDIFKPDQLERLLQVVVALPSGTSINPNTANEAVLNSLAPELSGAKIIAERQLMPQGFTSNEAFLQHDVTNDVDLSHTNLNVHSEYFQASIVARFQEHTTYLTSLLYRNPSTGAVTTLQRSQMRPHEALTDTSNTL